MVLNSQIWSKYEIIIALIDASRPLNYQRATNLSTFSTSLHPQSLRVWATESEITSPSIMITSSRARIVALKYVHNWRNRQSFTPISECTYRKLRWLYNATRSPRNHTLQVRLHLVSGPETRSSSLALTSKWRSLFAKSPQLFAKSPQSVYNAYDKQKKNRFWSFLIVDLAFFAVVRNPGNSEKVRVRCKKSNFHAVRCKRHFAPWQPVNW